MRGIPIGHVGRGTGFTRSGETPLADDIVSRDQLSLPAPSPSQCLAGDLSRCLGGLEGGGGLDLDLADMDPPRGQCNK